MILQDSQLTFDPAAHSCFLAGRAGEPVALKEQK
jgi:hypothetical protein